MKKFVSLFLVFLLVLVLAACGGGTASSAPASSAAAPAATASAADGGGGERMYKVAMVEDSSISDGGWGAACYNAMIDAAEKLGWESAYTDNIDQSAYFDTIASYCDLGYDMIYAPGNQYTDAVIQAAEEYPHIYFALLNGGEDVPGNAANQNITSLLPNAQQIGWIVGSLAGLMTETGTVAFIGGMELDTTMAKYEGYIEAATYVGKQRGVDVKVLDIVFAGSFSDSAKGMEFANTMIEQGADVFYGDASAVDSGARQAIDAYNEAQGSIKVYDIAQPSDLLGQNECIIGSVVADNSTMLALAMESVQDGTFAPEVIYGSMQNGSLSAGRTAEWIDPAVTDQYQEYLQQITDGTFMQ